MLSCILAFGLVGIFGASPDPLCPDYAGNPGVKLHVSKLGDNSDGRSWATAFTSIQAALDAVPDDRGGHVIIIRPDTYMEAMLSPAHPGAAGSYNLVVGDVSGSLGSGRQGSVCIDSGDPAAGFKSYDWWSTIRATQKGWSKEHTDETFSAIIWDRWMLRNLYVTGSDAGLFWDCTNRVEPFTVVVEDCVSMGRAFGGGVASCLSRPDEPIAFRRCQLWSLDWWGDTAGAYVRVENPAMPELPDIVFEDCTMVGPQCALKGGNYGFHTYMRVKTKNCRLIALNFSQPVGTPTDGVVQSVEAGKYLHVDLEDTLLMGYKPFGVKVDKESEKDIGFTVRGNVAAYVQFQQQVPEGMYRMDHWPTEAFASMVPPVPDICTPVKGKSELVQRDACEVSPFLWKGRLSLLVCIRPGSGGTKEDYHMVIRDVASGADSAPFGVGHSLACAMVHDETLYVFAARFEDNNWNDVTLFSSTDLQQWSSRVVIRQDPDEHLFNTSVCASPGGFVMAYETNDPDYPAFTVKFATSSDVLSWTKMPDTAFGRNRYTACPTIRYEDGWYYLLYLEHRTPRWYFETYIARSKDLNSWDLSAANPVLRPEGLEEGINASDPDLVEMDGATLLYYAVGDQRTWMNIKRATYPLGMAAFLASWFELPGIPETGR